MALRFSIITPTLNRHDMLVEALDSVGRQCWPEIEHIIVDGGSTDGTLELVAERPELHLIRGPDSGVYEALNKGIAAATGDVIGLLNSDDILEQKAIMAAALAFTSNPTCDSVCGSARLVADGETIEIYDCLEDKRLVSAHTALLGASTINARFFRKSALETIGRFSTAFSIVSDRDFLMRAITLGLRTTPIDALVYTYRRHRGSLSFSGEAARRPAVWLELLALARYWSQANEASAKTKRVARGLEGRCLGRLTQRELLSGAPGNAWRIISQSGPGLLSNLGAMGHGLMAATTDRIAVATGLR